MTRSATAPLVALFIVISLVVTSALWWFTAWFMLMGQVRWRVLVPTGVVTAFAMGVYGLSATVWMPSWSHGTRTSSGSSAWRSRS